MHNRVSLRSWYDAIKSVAKSSMVFHRIVAAGSLMQNNLIVGNEVEKAFSQITWMRLDGNLDYVGKR